MKSFAEAIMLMVILQRRENLSMIGCGNLSKLMIKFNTNKSLILKKKEGKKKEMSRKLPNHIKTIMILYLITARFLLNIINIIN